MLYFGSFNPIHLGHIALAEHVVSKELCDEVILIVSPRNPLKSDLELASEIERYTMSEIACAESRYPDRIKPSIVEFLLERPSYTINTLRYLSENYSSENRFSILMGGDLISQLERWRDYNEILDNYPIYVYPRRGEVIDRYLDKIHILEGAPLFDYSSTEIRNRLFDGESAEEMVSPGVAAHIKEQKLWNSDSLLELLELKREREGESAELFLRRGKWYYRRQRWGEALNDFARATKLEPENSEARELAEMVRQILEFRYVDIYNP
ncbi:MAG: nicotinate (nicotinamide) nucleotide adenylyltransferase [Rikenellaceae bacterium]